MTASPMAATIHWPAGQSITVWVHVEPPLDDLEPMATLRAVIADHGVDDRLAGGDGPRLPAVAAVLLLVAEEHLEEPPETSRNMPMAIAQTSTSPYGCWASSCIAPLLEAFSLRSPKASWSASQPTSRWTTP